MGKQIKHQKRNIQICHFLLGSATHRQKNQKTKMEADFLHACEFGDIPRVMRLIEKHEDLDFNCTDTLGRTPLRLAVESEHLDIVTILLDKTDVQTIHDAVLLAISLDHDDIALTILQHPSFKPITEHCSLSRANDDTLFSAETTPLILAAQRNRYEVISFLLHKGNRISEPHKNDCECKFCKHLNKIDPLRFAKSRLNAYKGLASESYICLSSEDPILAAFNIRRRLERAAEKEKHYREEYEQLRRGLDNFLIRVLDEVRGDAELDVILNVDELEEADDVSTLSRLKLALYYNEKKFVAHSSCQKKLTSYWYGDYFHYMKHLPECIMSVNAVFLALIYPLCVLLYWFAPKTKVGSFLKIPYVKFIGQCCMFFTFLMEIMISSLSEKTSPGKAIQFFHESHGDSREAFLWIIKYHPNITVDESEVQAIMDTVFNVYIRQYLPNRMQLVICLFLAGMMWNECKQIFDQGFKAYVRNVFNVVDFISLLLYVTSFTLRYVSYIKTSMALDYFDHKWAVSKLIIQDKEALYHWYWLISDRYYWKENDPMHICEGLFAVGNVFSFCRLFHLLAASETLGPLQVSLLRMIKDVSRFMVIFTIVMIAFLVGLKNLYWYYDHDIRVPIELPHHGHIETNAEASFGTLEKTFTTVFWTMFGMGDSDVVLLGESYHSSFTVRIGYLVYGAYNIAAVIILLNMLIAMMTRSFESIHDDEDLEWKFARSKLYMEFIEEGNTLPYPFNIIPSPKSIIRLCIYVFKCICCCFFHKDTQANEMATHNVRFANTPPEFPTHNARAKSNSLTNSDFSSVSTHKNSEVPNQTQLRKSSLVERILLGIAKIRNDKPSYQTVIRRVIKRYIFNSQTIEQSSLEVDVEEVKQDLSSFRFEMMNILQSQQISFEEAINKVGDKLDMMTNMDEQIHSKVPNIKPKCGGKRYTEKCPNTNHKNLASDEIKQPLIKSHLYVSDGSAKETVLKELIMPDVSTGTSPVHTDISLNTNNKNNIMFGQDAVENNVKQNIDDVLPAGKDKLLTLVNGHSYFHSRSVDSSYCACDECVNNSGISPNNEKHADCYQEKAKSSIPDFLGKLFVFLGFKRKF